MEDGTNDRIEMITWTQKSSLLAESFRTILTSILFSGDNGEKPQVLVLTSSSPKEGKTTVVCNLGISIAEINHNVLIIDADMRRPRIHSVFDLSNTTGLSNLLLQKDPLNSSTVDAAIQKTVIPGLVSYAERQRAPRDLRPLALRAPSGAHESRAGQV